MSEHAYRTVPKPKHLTTGQGLEAVQDDLDKQKNGSSASKIEVELHPKKGEASYLIAARYNSSGYFKPY